MAKVVVCGEVFLAKEEGRVGGGFCCLFQYGESGVQPRYCVCVCVCVCERVGGRERGEEGRREGMEKEV